MDSVTAAKIASIFDRAKAEALAVIGEAQPESEASDSLLQARDVAAILQTNTQAVYRLSREGKLTVIKLGPRTLRWTKEAVEDFISRDSESLQPHAKTLRLLQGKG